MITINSFGVELTKDERAKLYPRCGRLYPDGLSQLAKAEEYEQVRIIAENYAVTIGRKETKQNHLNKRFIFIFKGISTSFREYWHQPRRQDNRGQILRARS